MPQPVAPAPAAAPQNTGSFMDMFNPGVAAPVAMPQPAAQPAATPPATTLNGAPPSTDPLDIYASVFKIDPAAAPSPQDAMQAPLFNMDNKAFEAAVSGMNFAPTADPQLMQRILQGDHAALAQYVNQSNQAAFTQAVAFAQRLVERGVNTYGDRLQNTLPATFRTLATTNELATLAPNSQHAAAKPMLDVVQQNFMRANPTATPAQVAASMRDFVATLGAQLAPPPAKPTDPRDGSHLGGQQQATDWATLFNGG